MSTQRIAPIRTAPYGRKLTRRQVRAIVRRWQRGGIAISALGHQYGVGPACVSQIVTGQHYREHTADLLPLVADLPGEVWAWAKGYKDCYEVSTFGRVRRYYRSGLTKLVTLYPTARGPKVVLSRRAVGRPHYVADLVRTAFRHEPLPLPSTHDATTLSTQCRAA